MKTMSNILYIAYASFGKQTHHTVTLAFIQVD